MLPVRHPKSVTLSFGHLVDIKVVNDGVKTRVEVVQQGHHLQNDKTQVSHDLTSH